MKTMFVLGTRPEAIKMAPLVLAARRDSRISPIVCTTGQHREMLDQVNQYFGITADLDLGLMTNGQTLSDLTAEPASESTVIPH